MPTEDEDRASNTYKFPTKVWVAREFHWLLAVTLTDESPCAGRSVHFVTNTVKVCCESGIPLTNAKRPPTIRFAGYSRRAEFERLPSAYSVLPHLASS